jgi:hypothetical protein
MLLLAACGGNPSVSGSAPVSTPSTSEGPSASESVEPSVSDTPRPVDYVSIPQIITTAVGSVVTTRGYYMGNNVCTSYSGVEQYNSLYIADGDDWMQCFQVTKSVFPANMVVGETLLEITGTTAHYSKNGGLVTYELKPVARAEIVVDSQVEVPEFELLDSSTAALSDAVVNHGYELEDVEVVSKSANSYNNVTITFAVGSTTHTLYLDSRYTDVTVAAIANLVTGDSFSCKTFVGVNTGVTPQVYQFVFALDFVRTAA